MYSKFSVVQCSGCTKKMLFKRLLKVSKKLRITSTKVFSLLKTSIGEATGIDCEYLFNILLIPNWCILKLETFASHLTSSVLYWYAVKNKVIFKPINNYLTVSYCYITTNQDDVRNSRHALPYRCRRERA